MRNYKVIQVTATNANGDTYSKGFYVKWKKNWYSHIKFEKYTLISLKDGTVDIDSELFPTMEEAEGAYLSHLRDVEVSTSHNIVLNSKTNGDTTERYR